MKKIPIFFLENFGFIKLKKLVDLETDEEVNLFAEVLVGCSNMPFLSAMTLSIAKLSIMAISIAKLSIMALSIMRLSITTN